MRRKKGRDRVRGEREQNEKEKRDRQGRYRG